jgi:hypothetical protein
VETGSAHIARNDDVSARVNMGAPIARRDRGDARRNNCGKSGKPLAFGLTQKDWSDTSSAAMRSHVGDDRHAAKRLGNILECSPRTAENFLLGRTTPSGIHFLRAYAMIPEFTAEVRRLTGMQSSQDPTFERDLANFLVRASKHLDQMQNSEEMP